jgi:hypothetical protein
MDANDPITYLPTGLPAAFYALFPQLPPLASPFQETIMSQNEEDVRIEQLESHVAALAARIENLTSAVRQAQSAIALSQ